VVEAIGGLLLLIGAVYCLRRWPIYSLIGVFLLSLIGWVTLRWVVPWWNNSFIPWLQQWGLIIVSLGVLLVLLTLARRQQRTSQLREAQAPDPPISEIETTPVQLIPKIKIAPVNPISEIETLVGDIKTFQPRWDLKGRKLLLGENGTNAELAEHLKELGWNARKEVTLPNKKRADLLVNDEYIIEAKPDLGWTDSYHIGDLTGKLVAYEDFPEYSVIVVIYGDARKDQLEVLDKLGIYFLLVVLGEEVG